MGQADIVLRPGDEGAKLVPDRAYARAFTLRVGRTDQSYVDLDDPRRLEFDYVQQMAEVIDCLAAPGMTVAAGPHRRCGPDPASLRGRDPAEFGPVGASNPTSS